MQEAKSFYIASKRRSRDLLLVPKELIDHYQPVVGAVGVALWLNLYAYQDQELSFDRLAIDLRCTPGQLEEALCSLIRYELVRSEIGEMGSMLYVSEPLSFEEFQELEARLSRQAPDSLGVLFDFYQKQVGLMGPVQEEKLRHWVVEQGMDIEVVVAAIVEMMKTSSRRIEYLEGILRNWYNEGIRNLDDLTAQRKRWTEEQGKRSKKRPKEGKKTPGFMKSLPGETQAVTKEGYEGVANAGAYRRVDPEAVKRWKEMFKDEYSS